MSPAAVRRAAAPPGPRAVHVCGQVVGYVEPTPAGFVGKVDGAVVATCDTERQAVVAVHDFTRRARIAKALA